MKKIVTEIEDCWQCPYSISDAHSEDQKVYCRKLNHRELIMDKTESKTGNTIYYPIPEDCPQQLETQTPLTEDNILGLGFVEYRNPGDWEHYILGKFVVTKCLFSDENFKKGDWYYGMDNIRFNTVEELKSLYKLVTKKEL